MKNTKTTQKVCGNASKKEERPQINEVFKNTETPQKKEEPPLNPLPLIIMCFKVSNSRRLKLFY